jgi:hypothetical protein
MSFHPCTDPRRSTDLGGGVDPPAWLSASPADDQRRDDQERQKEYDGDW